MSITVWKWAEREPFGVGPSSRGGVCGRLRKNNRNLFRAQLRPSELLRALTHGGARNSVRGSCSLI